VQAPSDLAKSGTRIIAAGEGVPITRYAQQVVANLARQPGYPADFAATYAANVVSREDNVKVIVAKIELGEGDAGIVYVTDARASKGVKAVDIPDAANVPASYAGVVVKSSTNVAGATAFLDWFAGPEGQSILLSFGFQPPA
jgi:molybdate transport system substrate-binding protein